MGKVEFRRKALDDAEAHQRLTCHSGCLPSTVHSTATLLATTTRWNLIKDAADESARRNSEGRSYKHESCGPWQERVFASAVTFDPHRFPVLKQLPAMSLKIMIMLHISAALHRSFIAASTCLLYYP